MTYFYTLYKITSFYTLYIITHCSVQFFQQFSFPYDREIHKSDWALTPHNEQDWVETSVYANYNKEANMATFKQDLIE